MKPDHWQGKVCLITGGSSGIGLCMGEQLAAAGAHVWLMARNPQRLDAALGQVTSRRARPAQICGIAPADVADPQQVEQAIRLVTGNAGLPDVLIHAAGVVHPGYFQQIPLKTFHEDMQINHFGAVHTTHFLAPKMIERKSGQIVFISSGAGYFGMFGYTSYSATKFALAGFSDALRSELKPYGIRVSIAYPSDVDTPGFREELTCRPPETSAIAGSSKISSAERVARQILDRAARGDYMIFPGSDSYLWYTIVRLAGSLRYPIVDWIIAGAQQKRRP